MLLSDKPFQNNKMAQTTPKTYIIYFSSIIDTAEL